MESLTPERGPTDGLEGKTVSHYAILERLSGGGMGVVYKARDARLDRTIALKFLLPHLRLDDAAERRFVVEAKAAASLDHPNICTIHEIGETDDGQLFIAMPLYDGESLGAKLDRGPLGVSEAVEYTVQICTGLGKAHERGIVHRDIKPANILVTEDGLVKILDFGIAKLADVNLTATGGVIGTVAYMSPEQTSGLRVDNRADIWSVGVLLYEMLSGELPFKGSTLTAMMHAVLNKEPVPLCTLSPDTPVALQHITHRALTKDPEDRYQTIGDLAEALAVLDQSMQNAAGSVIPTTRDTRPSATARLLPEGEHRHVTIVVSYVGGYNQMVERLTPKQVDQVAERIEQLAEEIVKRHGGVVNRCSGEEIVAVFGIPTTHEDDVVRAARATAELHSQVRSMELSAEFGLDERVELQSGIDVGSVVAQAHPTGDQRYRIVGDPLQKAGRVAAEAEAGEILVSGECQRLLAPFFETEEGEPIRLKGGMQTIPHRLLRESRTQSRLEAAHEIDLTAYTGRETELATLRDKLDHAVGGGCQFVSIIGDAGLGKSRLLYEFRSTIDTGSVTVLQGRCQSYGSNIAYLPFLRMLRESLGLPDDDPRPDQLQTSLQQLQDIDPGLEEFFPLYLHLLSITTTAFAVPKHMKGEDLRLAIMEALSAILISQTSKQPLVLLLEDWHWVDDASADVLKQLVAMAPSYPMLAVVTYRPDYSASFGTISNYTAIHLTPLELSSSLVIVESVLEVDAVPHDLGSLLHERTGGNPFFLEEISHTLLEDGTVKIEDRRVVLTGDLDNLQLPDTVQGVIRSRLDRMDPQAREVLSYASVIGREFDRDILQRIRADDPRLLQSLETLKGLGVIQQTRILPDVSFRFKHALTQEVTYESLLHHQRRDLHGRVGAAFEDLRADRIEEHYDPLARHFARAEEWPKAVKYGMKSASRAWELSEFQESLKILENTEAWLLKLEDDPFRQQTLIKLLLRKERLFESTGLRRRQLEIIDRLIALLEPLGDGPAFGEAYLRLGDVHILLRNYVAAETALTKSLEISKRIEDTISERKTLRSLGLLRWHQGRNDEALDVMENVLAADQESGDTDAVLADIMNLTSVLKALGEYERCQRHLEEALDLADRINNPVKKVYMLHTLGQVCRLKGDDEAALGHFLAAIDVAAKHRLLVQQGFDLPSAALIYWERGDTEKALQTWEEAVRVLRKAQHAAGLSQTTRTLGEVLIGLDRHQEALPYLQEAATLFARLEDRQAEARVWNNIGTVFEREGDYPDAMAAWGKGRTLSQQITDSALELDIVESMARLTRRDVPEPSLALQYYREALALAEATDGTAKEGELRNTMAIIEWERGNYQESLQHYERALEIFQACDETSNVGHILNSIGVTLHKLGRVDDAIERLEAAVRHNQEEGARQLEGFALAALGDVCYDTGRVQEAIAYYSQSLDIRREIGDRRGAGWMLHYLARAHATSGALDRKRDCATEAWRIADACDDKELIDALRGLPN